MYNFLQAAEFIGRKAGKILRDKTISNLVIEHKGKIDIVTEMDKKSEEIIIDFLSNEFPEHKIISEEGGNVEGESGYVWYIDPLDGTTNYAYGLPWYSVSIALHKDGKPITGIVYNPALDELFAAQAGEGAFRNGIRINVSDRDKLGKSLLATGFPYYVVEKPRRVLDNLEKFLTHSHGVRRFGSAALDLAYVAAGMYDGFWEEGLKPWDTAAGILMIMETGGKVTDYKGDNYNIMKDTIVASNGKIHEEMLQLIRI